jgi:amino acid transporter
MAKDMLISSPTLDRGKLGNGAVLFQSIGQISPAGGIATTAVLAVNFAGGAIVPATIVSILACLMTALAISQLAAYLPSAGSLGTYISRGLGGAAGFVAGWMYAISELLIVALIALLIGELLGGVTSSEFGWSSTATWVITVIVMYLLTSLVHELGVGVSTRVQQVISIIEILLFAVLSITLIVSAGNRNTISLFGTSHGNIKGYIGAAGLFPAAVFIITAFGGFETGASLAEEAKEPRRAVRTAVVGSVLGVGILYVLTSYAATAYFGPNKMGSFAAFNNGDPWTGMTRAVWGVGWVALFLIVENSLYAAANATTNVSTRMMFSLSRVGLGPRWFNEVNRRRTPRNALIVVSGVGLALSLWLGLQYGPITGLSIIVITSTSMYISLYILTNLACIAYFLRYRRQDFNWIKHMLIPVVGIVVFFPALLSTLGVPAFSFISKLQAPLTYGAYAAIAIVIGLVGAAIYAATQRREAFARLGLAFDEAAHWTGGVQPINSGPPAAATRDDDVGG